MATTWVRNSPGIRLTIIGLLTFILFIGSLIIRDLISEREHRRIEAVSEVSEKWGKAQVISGPVLTIPYLVYFKKNNDEVYSSTYYAHFLPENLDIKGEVDPQIRRRGIYEIVLYGSRLQLSGNFTLPDFSLLNIMDKDILWNDAFLGIGVSDMVGIQDVIKIKWNKDEFKANPGIETNDVFSTGLSAPVSVNKNEPGYTFSISLDINGSESLMFTPVGQKSEANISSTWENPGFDGRYIPDDHQITDQGFTANWKILHLNRDYPQQWLGNKYSIHNTYFGFNLLLPVEHYQKTMRTAKYSLLFILLTFLSFFMVELLNKRTLHPIQYLMIGLALLIFYTLLLSFSEYMAFGIAYLLSSVAIVLLIALYTRGMLKSNLLAAVVTGILFVLYGYLYIILQLQDFALLMGSIGLFAVLALTMYLTRKIDWYNILKNNGEK